MKSLLQSLLNPAHPLRSGVLFWCSFSLIGVVIQGVRWDENYEFAQVLLGQVPFPEDHPLHQYVWRLFSIQHISLAGLMIFVKDPLWVNGFRNVLFLLSSTVPVYLWGTSLSRRPLIGHVAVVLILMEIHVPFLSSYPIHVWPGVFSNGPVGLGYMLLSAWALATGRHRLAGGLIGFAPLVHLGQFPPLLAMTVLYLGWLAIKKHHPEAKRLVLASLPGVTMTILLGLILRAYSTPPPTDGAYFTAAEPMRIWHHFMAHFASHRAIPYTIGHILLAGSLLFGVQLLWLQRREKRTASTGSPPLSDPTTAWAIIYLAIASLTVWIIMAIHYAAGSDVPFLFAAWLPYRLMNHVGPLLIPLLLAVTLRRSTSEAPVWLPLLLLATLLGPLLQLVSVELATRYITEGDYLFFLLFGLASSVLTRTSTDGSPPWGLRASVLLSMVLLACFHQFGAACMALGWITGLLPTPPRPTARELRGLATCLVAVLLIVLLTKHGERSKHLFVEPIFQQVAQYLEEAGEDDAMVLTPYQQIGTQMKTGHPIMADMATQFYGMYVPPIAPSVAAIFQDFYGLQFDPNAPASQADLPWYGVWPAKSLKEWQHLSVKYELHYVLAPDFMDLPLEKVVDGNGNNLYKIPLSQ